MPVVGLLQLLSRARAGRYGVPAFNVITLEYADAIVTAAEETAAPVILQVSQNAIRYHGGRLEPIAAACRTLAERASVPVALHLDHATTRALCTSALQAGFGSIMFDGSALPDAENVRETASVVAWAHAAGLAVEAEIGIIGGKDGHHEVGAPTEPEDAERFVRETGVDALAVQVGTSHAMTEQTAALDLERIARLRAGVPVPLVLHGSYGVPDTQLAAAVMAGLTKVNIGTRLNVAFTTAVRRRLSAQPDLVDPRPYLAEGREAVSGAAAGLLRTLGAAGRAGDIDPPV